MSNLNLFYNKHDREIAVPRAMELLKQLFPNQTEAEYKVVRQKYMRMSGDAISTDIFCMEKELARKVVA